MDFLFNSIGGFLLGLVTSNLLATLFFFLIKKDYGNLVPPWNGAGNHGSR